MNSFMLNFNLRKKEQVADLHQQEKEEIVMNITIKQKQLDKIKPKYDLLTTNGFIIGLTILLVNDLWLKYSFPSILTGKLSDFAGLFIFPYFLSVFIPKPKPIYYLTALLFTFWKLEYSQIVIDFFARLTDLGFHRTVDITDLIALTILPFSFRYFKLKSKTAKSNRFVFSTLVCFISIFSFYATSVPRQTFNVNIEVDKIFILPINKEELLTELSYSDALSKNLTDSLFYVYYYIPDYGADATAIAKIKSLGNDSTSIQLISITQYGISGALFSGVKQSNIDACKNLKSADFENLFELNYINILLQKKGRWRYLGLNNKELIDKYNKEKEVGN